MNGSWRRIAPDWTRLQILVALDGSPGASLQAVARQLRISAATVHRHVWEASRAGQLSIVGSTNRTRRYPVTAAGGAEIARLRGHFIAQLDALVAVRGSSEGRHAAG